MTIPTGSSYLDTLASSPSTSKTTKASTGTGALDQSAFLKLMTTQMQTQDPFNPVDNTQMVAQMAQFSSTTGIAQMNATLSKMAGDLASSRVGDAAGWIGKSALVASSSATALSDGSFAGTVTLPSDASQATISLVDPSGNVVYNGTASNVAKGDVPFMFDGKDASGNAVTGPLKISVNAKDLSAQPMTGVTTAAWAAITGVQSPASGTTKLVTGAGVIDPTAALQLS
jgi:flagellar basal-body rod modification protein FlgD